MVVQQIPPISLHSVAEVSGKVSPWVHESYNWYFRRVISDGQLSEKVEEFSSISAFLIIIIVMLSACGGDSPQGL